MPCVRITSYVAVIASIVGKPATPHCGCVPWLRPYNDTHDPGQMPAKPRFRGMGTCLTLYCLACPLDNGNPTREYENSTVPRDPSHTPQPTRRIVGGSGQNASIPIVVNHLTLDRPVNVGKGTVQSSIINGPIQ